MSPGAVFAHVSGVPVEELLLPLVYGAGGLWVAVRVFTSRSRSSRRRRAR